jgi:DNA-directed RNA polymerase specialized sigma subunit
MTNRNTFEEITSDSEEIIAHEPAQRSDDSPAKKDSSLEALVDQEQSIARKNLQNELGREPSQEEIDKWLSAHTESY